MKAPTIIVKIRGYHLFDEDAIFGYANLKVGDGAILLREPDNPHDSNAVIVERNCDKCGGHPVGYVDRDSAKTLARWIDKGWVYTGLIVRGPCIEDFGLFAKMSPTPEAEVKCIPHQPLLKKEKRKIHDFV